jgi:hypothetical protein
VRRIGELGWVEGRNVRIEYRGTDGVIERAIEIAPTQLRRADEVIQ